MLLLFSLSLFFFYICTYVSVRLIFGVVVLYLRSRRRIVSLMLSSTIHIHRFMFLSVSNIGGSSTSTQSRAEKNICAFAQRVQTALNQLSLCSTESFFSSFLLLFGWIGSRLSIYLNSITLNERLFSNMNDFQLSVLVFI